MIDDDAGRTLAAAATTEEKVVGKVEGGRESRLARKRSARPSQNACSAKKVDKVIFDRGGFLYHGKVKALADAAREGGLKF